MRKEISATIQEVAPDVVFGENVRIVGERVFISSGVVIGNDVTMRANEIHIGYRTTIQERCNFSAIGGPAELIRIGDFSFIAYDTRILLPILLIGDYTAIHNHVVVSGYKTCRIGHNSFIGQHSVLNASEELTIGNNFRMALNGYIWTHAESGELLEGCNFYYRAPTVIEDNVWLMGCNITISPGVRLGNGSIILMGSVVTKDTLPKHCYGGVPARDLTEKLKPYREIGFDEKVAMMKGFINGFIEHYGTPYQDSFEFIPEVGTKIDNPNVKIIIIEQGPPIPLGEGKSVYSLSDKTYLKQRTEIEERFMRFLVGARARFIPIE
jgi:acetyltransferase-like isoleucine patch superfamily enzyme